jgi:hypothetical protein
VQAAAFDPQAILQAAAGGQAPALVVMPQQVGVHHVVEDPNFLLNRCQCLQDAINGFVDNLRATVRTLNTQFAEVSALLVACFLSAGQALFKL